MMSREQLHHLSGAYVLGALDEDERRAFEACLGDWEDMRAEVTELADTAAALGLAVPPAAPRPEAKDRLLALVASTPQAASAPRRHLARRRPRLARPQGRLLAAAVAIVAALVSVDVLLPRVPQHGTVGLASIEQAEDAQRTPVAMAEADDAVLVWSAELETAALEWDRLPALPSGHAYQLWYVGDVPRPAGVIADPEQEGFLVLEGTMRPDDVVAITVEPAGGSPEPTSAPVVVVEPA